MTAMRSVCVLVLVAGCFAPSVREGVPCATNGACPGGLSCDLDTNTCIRPGGPSVDGPGDTSCPAGFTLDGTACVDIDECGTATHDCNADASCTNEAGAYDCTCNPGFVGDGRACTRICNTVLIYDDCNGDTDGDCAAISEIQFADNAAAALGIAVKYGGVADQGEFRSLFDAGGFDVLIFESSLSAIDGATADRVASWVDGGGRAIVSFWDLDNDSTGKTIRNALEVNTTGEIMTPRDVHRDPASTVDFFSRVETFDSPLTFTHPMIDDGDELAIPPGGAGFIAARHGSPTGDGAIAVTKNDRAITLGFVPIGLVFQGPRDADADGKPDAQELYANLIGYLCGY